MTSPTALVAGLRFVLGVITSIVIACLFAGVVRIAAQSPGGWWGEAQPTVARAAVSTALTDGARWRIESALEVARAERGRYPASLGDVVSAGLLRAADLTSPLGAHWEYRAFATEDRYELAAPVR